METHRCDSCGAAVSSFAPGGLCLGCRPTAELLGTNRTTRSESDIRELLIQYRLDRHRTQAVIAEELGIGQPQVSRILSGDQRLTSDMQRRILQLVGVRPLEFGLSPVVSRLDADALMLAGSATALARSLRDAGRPREAGQLFWPTLERLELAYSAGQADPDLGLLLCEARGVNAVIIGDLSNEHEHRWSVAGARNAVALGNIYGDQELRAHQLNLLGNQLRVVGELDDARVALEEAVAVGSDPLVRAASQSWMARVTAEQGDADTFRTSVTAARRSIDQQHWDSPLVNQLSIAEIEARGLVQLGLPHLCNLFCRTLQLCCNCAN